MIFLQSITLTNSPALRGHGDGLQDLDRLNAFFFFGSRKSRHGGITDTRNFFGLIRIVAGHWLPCKRVHFRKFLHFCDHIFPLFLIIFIFQTTKSAHFYQHRWPRILELSVFQGITVLLLLCVLWLECWLFHVYPNPCTATMCHNQAQETRIQPEEEI